MHRKQISVTPSYSEGLLRRNALVLAISIVSLYASGYWEGAFPRLGLIAVFIGGIALLNIASHQRQDANSVTQSESFCVDKFLLVALCAASVLALACFANWMSADLPIRELRELYGNTYESVLKPIGHIVWFAGCLSVPYKALISRHLRQVQADSSPFSLKQSSRLAAFSFAAFFGPAIPIVLWAILRYWEPRSLATHERGRR